MTYITNTARSIRMVRSRTVLLNVSETDGSVEITVTTSSSQTLVMDTRFVGTAEPDYESDYRRYR